MNHSYGLIVESLAAVSLIVMLGYCVMLDWRLKRLKANEQSLKTEIDELIAVTGIAEREIAGLKQAMRNVDNNLIKQITAATELTGQLTCQLTEGEALIQRLSKIAIAARPQQERGLLSARAIAEAAQAFSERIRDDGLAA